MRSQIILTVCVVGLLASGRVLADQSALGQLQNATSGSQTTGTTFDGSQRPQPDDALPNSSSSNSPPPVSNPVPDDSSTNTTSGYDVNGSTNTTGGYDVNGSSNTTGGYDTNSSTSTSSGNSHGTVGTESTQQ